MNGFDTRPTIAPAENDCEAARAGFSSYLDGAVSGLEMASIAAHLDSCGTCSAEFHSWRSIQSALTQLGPLHPPATLQAQLRRAVAAEREAGTHLSFGARLVASWKSTLAPLALRTAGGLAAAVFLLGSATWFFGPGLTVQANDDRMAHLTAPRYLYSQVPPQPIFTGHEVPILVAAQIDAEGRVYDYEILTGPTDAKVKVRVQDNLLSSVFKPATAFGIPVRGQVVMTYTGVSVHG